MNGYKNGMFRGIIYGTKLLSIVGTDKIMKVLVEFQYFINNNKAKTDSQLIVDINKFIDGCRPTKEKTDANKIYEAIISDAYKK